MSPHPRAALAAWSTGQPPAPAMPRPTPLSEALRDLATMGTCAHVLDAGTQASARTLTAGLTQHTQAALHPDTLRKHRARLRAALGAMADALEREEAERG